MRPSGFSLGSPTRLMHDFTMALKVSNTPSPCTAQARSSGTPSGTARASCSSCERKRGRQVALVVLNHQRHATRVVALQEQVGFEVADAVDVVVEALALAVDHEHDAVDVAQHQAARLIEGDLTGHGAQVETHRVAAELSEVDRAAGRRTACARSPCSATPACRDERDCSACGSARDSWSSRRGQARSRPP